MSEKLTKICTFCDGNGRYIMHDGVGPCWPCHGTGQLPLDPVEIKAARYDEIVGLVDIAIDEAKRWIAGEMVTTEAMIALVKLAVGVAKITERGPKP